MTFVHNLFSVQFFYDRMPLYIIAMYPVFGYISYVLVQRTGIFKNYNVVVGALSVAFVFHCLFEVVDTVGPQWKWWAWNTQLSTSTPALGVVPYLNIQAISRPSRSCCRSDLFCALGCCARFRTAAGG